MIWGEICMKYTRFEHATKMRKSPIDNLVKLSQGSWRRQLGYSLFMCYNVTRNNLSYMDIYCGTLLHETLSAIQPVTVLHCYTYHSQLQSRFLWFNVSCFTFSYIAVVKSCFMNHYQLSSLFLWYNVTCNTLSYTAFFCGSI